MNPDSFSLWSLLDQISSEIDSDVFPTTANFLERLKFLAENFSDESGNIEVNRIALSIVTTVGSLEQRIQTLEKTLADGVARKSWTRSGAT
ncbi:hypothetical protein [Corynebacterium striatum]|uniref:hypothetical protein n=1 Tax=Corynebacterium striatum TaxID=43770 RepID=UPI0010414887|nr:hypothetical protein [Corynebacterium striatum]